MEGVEEQGLGKKKGQGQLRGADGKKRTEQNRIEEGGQREREREREREERERDAEGKAERERERGNGHIFLEI